MIILLLTASGQMAAQGKAMGLRSCLLVPVLRIMLMSLRRRMLPVRSHQLAAWRRRIQVVHPMQLCRMMMRLWQPGRRQLRRRMCSMRQVR